MSMEDPFFVVKGEVEKAVNSAKGLHQRWSELLQAPGSATKEEVDWTTNELRNSLRSIEWDLEDLDETINILQRSNPKKFNLDTLELTKRKAFITSTRQAVKEMKEHMSSPAAMSIPDQTNRQVCNTGIILVTLGVYGGPAEVLVLTEQQEDQLELVSGTIGVLKNMSERIGLELDEQAGMLDDFTHEVDHSQSKLDNLMKKLTKVSHMTSEVNNCVVLGVEHLEVVLEAVVVLRMGSKNKKRGLLPARPETLSVDQVLEDMEAALPHDPIFSILQAPHPGTQGSEVGKVEVKYRQGQRYLEVNQRLREVRGHLGIQREALQAAGEQLDRTVTEVKGRAL
ncbi:hypothetical protein NHX12_033411 [Muraenolepis orangiensis]|uniref:t-SNARE coiled-coil homology domain-containing protein n=1 Tax=Muraenolepis orangiensis TaxID=630683 RepID=A0A9Q0E5G9_9TELE|nr:hypothetical protein NHX12_033411 [Muraenolepis orangiensis]